MDFNSANEFTHEAINNIQQLSHQIIDNTFENVVPLVNSFTNVNIDTNNIACNLLNYYKKETQNEIYICVEIPGIEKDLCKVNFTNGVLLVEASTNYCDDLNWNFIKDKKYVRSIKLENVSKENINIKYLNGTLRIIITKNINSENNINID